MKRHLELNGENDLIETLSSIIKVECKEIKKSLYGYCEEQLDSVFGLELQPELSRKFPGIGDYQLRLSKGRGNNSSLQKLGWPDYKIFIAWTDDYNEFQEFSYPLNFDHKNHRFHIQTDDFISKFARYRDNLV